MDYTVAQRVFVPLVTTTPPKNCEVSRAGTQVFYNPNNIDEGLGLRSH